MNRIQAAIDRQEKNIQERLANGTLTQENLDKLAASLDMPMDEYVMFQELKSVATEVILTLDESMTVYGYLGNVPDQFNRQPPAVKVVLTQLFKELLQRRIIAKATA